MELAVGGGVSTKADALGEGSAIVATDLDKRCSIGAALIGTWAGWHVCFQHLRPNRRERIRGCDHRIARAILSDDRPDLSHAPFTATTTLLGSAKYLADAGFDRAPDNHTRGESRADSARIPALGLLRRHTVKEPDRIAGSRSIARSDRLGGRRGRKTILDGAGGRKHASNTSS